MKVNKLSLQARSYCLILNPAHAFVEHIIVMPEYVHREIIDDVCDEKGGKHINRVVIMAHQHHHAERGRSEQEKIS